MFSGKKITGNIHASVTSMPYCNNAPQFIQANGWLLNLKHMGCRHVAIIVLCYTEYYNGDLQLLQVQICAQMSIHFKHSAYSYIMIKDLKQFQVSTTVTVITITLHCLLNKTVFFHLLK